MILSCAAEFGYGSRKRVHSRVTTSCFSRLKYVRRRYVSASKRIGSFSFSDDALRAPSLETNLASRPRDVRFRYGKYGKPELISEGDQSGLAFNLAHSGTRVAFALGYYRRIGIDIEQGRAGLDLLDLARHYFCAREVAALEQAPWQATKAFFKYRTLKEAFMKAEGSGLAMQLTALDVASVPDGPPRLPVLPIEDVSRGIHVQRLSAFEGVLRGARGGRRGVDFGRPYLARLGE